MTTASLHIVRFSTSTTEADFEYIATLTPTQVQELRDLLAESFRTEHIHEFSVRPFQPQTFDEVLRYVKEIGK